MTLPARERTIAGSVVRMRDREWLLWCALQRKGWLTLAQASWAIGKPWYGNPETYVRGSIALLRAVVGRDVIVAAKGGYALRKDLLP